MAKRKKSTKASRAAKKCKGQKLRAYRACVKKALKKKR